MHRFHNKELEEQLTAVGNSLLQPPSSLDDLMPLLDEIENLLSKVEQSPTQSMQTALSPLMKALVMEELLNHSDADVKVSVASCISEITRITAPDAPYDDDRMKDVFQLIVSSFEDLSDTSSRSYEKRATILETVAKVRSCVIMLDLECDQMIIEMFQHFLKAIRDDHVEIIFASMETIMTLVLEESEEVSPDLLNPILATLKMNNEAVMPIAKKLAERVIQSSADKIRPYLVQAVKSLDASFDDYGEVVASVCRENSDTVGNSNESISRDQPVAVRKSASTSPARDQVTQVAKDGGEESKYQEKDPTLIGSSKSIVSNGINETGTEEIMADANSSRETDSNHEVSAKSMSKTESDDSGSQNPAKLKAKTEKSETLEVADNHENLGKNVPTSPTEIESAEAAESLEKVEDTTTQLSASQAAENETANVASPTQSGSLCNESRSKRDSLAKRKGNLVREQRVSVHTASKKASEGKSILKAKKQRQSGKKQPDETTNKDKASADEGASKNDEGSTSDSETRSLDQTEEIVPVHTASKKASEVKSILKAKKQRSGKKQSDKTTKKDKASTDVGASKNDEGSASDSETRSLDQTEPIVSVRTASKKASEGKSILKAKKQRSGKKQSDETTNKDKASTDEGASKNDEGSTSDSETRSLDQTEQIVSVHTASKKASEGKSILKAKKQRSGKKQSDETTNTDKASTEEGASQNDEGSTSDSEARSPDQTENLGNASNNTEDGSSMTKEHGKKSGRVKPMSGKGSLKSSAKEVRTDTVTSPKSLLQSMKAADIKEETPRMSSKRKRTPGSEKASDSVKYGKNLVGSKVQVWWPDDQMFYAGVIASYDSSKKKHKVVYNDGDEEVLNLRQERWEFVRDDLVSNGDDDVRHSSHDTPSDVPRKKKKGNPNSETSKGKGQKMVETSPKSKLLKDTATKSGGKSKDDDKTESEAKDKNNSKASRKSVDDFQKHGAKSQSSGGRSKDDSLKTLSHMKEESQKNAAKSKSKTPQSGTTKTSSSSKVKETDRNKEKTLSDLAKSPETVKLKSADTSKSRESETKSAKKRRR